MDTDLSGFENPDYFDLLSRAAREATWRPGSVLNNLVSLFRGTLSLLLMAGILFSLNWWLALLLVAVNIPGIIVRIRFSGLLYKSNREHTPDARKSAYFNWLLTGDRPARELKMFSLGNFFRERFEQSFLKQKTDELRILRKQTYTESAIIIMKGAAVAGALWIVAWNAFNGTSGPGISAMILLAFRQGMVYLKEVFISASGLYDDSVFVSDAYNFLNDDNNRSAGQENNARPVFNKSVEFVNVSFTYPGSDKPVIDNISFTVKKGETVALAGHNGAGKSTLVKLLTHLYEPSGGKILIDGTDYTKIDTNEYRKLFSVVFQDFLLYNLTAGENISLSDLSGPPDLTRIKKSAAGAGIDKLLESLPSSWNTDIGNLFGDSRELSWGEWQKIAIARALYRNAPFLILDEPSSALDAASEIEIFGRIREILKDKTGLIISHRLTNISLADRIIVMRDGKIAEAGNHSELMAARGEYFDMYTKQAERYGNKL
jgi:ATP-binding cassette subfamily B protein